MTRKTGSQSDGGELIAPVGFEVRSLSDRLAELLRSRILSGEMVPQLPIKQDVLAAELTVSKIPLREALARLQQDGLVVSIPNRGFFVTPLSEAEAREVYSLRLRIEPDAVADGALKASIEDQAHVRSVFDQLQQAGAENDIRTLDLHRRFHMALIEPGAGPLTSSIAARLHIISDRYVKAHLEPAGRSRRAAIEHQDIFDAWIARRAKDLKSLIRRHIQITMKDLSRQLKGASARSRSGS